MENRTVRTAPRRDKGPIKVKSGDFEPPGCSSGPLVDDRPPTGATPADSSDASPGAGEPAADPQS